MACTLILHVNEDRLVQKRYLVSIFLQNLPLSRQAGQNHHSPIFPPHTRELKTKLKYQSLREEKVRSKFPYPLKIYILMWICEDNAKRGSGNSTHIEVICVWVINHFNKIDYVGMAHNFHY